MSDFASISLEQLNDHASLQTRIDRKYLLPQRLVSDLLGDCPRNTRVLRINDRELLDYQSTYFDTPTLGSYHRAAYRHRRRFKVRTRLYRDTDTAFLEVKLRGPRGLTVKERLPISREDTQRITPDGRQFITATIPADLLTDDEIQALQPQLHNNYRRSTRWLPDDQARFTVDTGLSWRLPRGGAMVNEELAVIETKSPATGGTSAVDHWLWEHGYRPVRMSKFAAGLAVLNPELPANAWHRPLQLLKSHSSIQITAIPNAATPNATTATTTTQIRTIT
ncbi:MAG: polyphosphate polymerase domain-containing protein [Gulosibacter sp.]|uniref:polyphosphate polymerase domain-containing protein n=1 Tax=Gulosibacter sp. TaxID=2817531 RepID=UPI003F8EEF2A